MYKFLKEQVEVIKTKELEEDLPIDEVIDSDVPEDTVIEEDELKYNNEEIEEDINNDTEEKLDAELADASTVEKDKLLGGIENE